MSSATTSVVYLQVAEEVIEKVREGFVCDGGRELQGLWELKMIQAGAVLPPSERPRTVMKPTATGAAATTPFHDLNVPYQGNEEYETPTAEMLFPPTPLQTPMQTPLPGTADNSMYNIPTGFSDYSTPNTNDAGDAPVDIKPGVGTPSPYMPPPSLWMNQRPAALGVDVNVGAVYVCSLRGWPGRDRQRILTTGNSVESQVLGRMDLFTGPNGKRKRDEFPPQFQENGYIPQQDGAGDTANDIFELEIIQSDPSGRGGIIANFASAQQSGSSSKIPQLDGPIPDPYEDMLSTPNIYNYQGVVNEDYNVVHTPAPNDMQAATPAPLAQNDAKDEDDDDEPPLNENDDDDDFDDIDQVEELNTQHLVLAQFDKVTRTKSRWKCTLKDGIMQINNKDILFNKASGEFDF